MLCLNFNWVKGIQRSLTQSRSRSWGTGRSHIPERSRTGRRRPGLWSAHRSDTSSFPFYHTARPTPEPPPSWPRTPADLQTYKHTLWIKICTQKHQKTREVILSVFSTRGLPSPVFKPQLPVFSVKQPFMWSSISIYRNGSWRSRKLLSAFPGARSGRCGRFFQHLRPALCFVHNTAVFVSCNPSSQPWMQGCVSHRHVEWEPAFNRQLLLLLLCVSPADCEAPLCAASNLPPPLL